MDEALDLGTIIPFKLLEQAVISATNSPFIFFWFENWMLAPISIKVLYKPILNSLTHTFTTLILLLGVIIAETIGNEALEGSAGIFRFNGFRSGTPSKVIFHDILSNWVVVILAPKNFNILSVWSLDKVGSMTVVFPNEDNPASKMLDFTWADGTELSYSIGRTILLPLIFIGKLFVWLPIVAPVFFKGVVILFIGLFDNDSSPMNVASISDPAIKPINNLAPVPEFPIFRV